jgi:hypothetical protein
MLERSGFAALPNDGPLSLGWFSAAKDLLLLFPRVRYARPLALNLWHGETTPIRPAHPTWICHRPNQRGFS